MNQKHTVTVPELGIKIATGTLAKFANGAVTVTIGETTVFVSATVASTMRPGQDFFPLTVDYREKYAAAGRFPGGFFKREGRPSEKEILTSRLCDRPCRPLFPSGFLNEVQIIGILLSADQAHESDISMVNGASAALAISDIPWDGPIGAVRVGQIDGQFVANPTIEQMFSSSLDLIYVGNEKDMLMIEGSADQLPEDRFIEALEFAHQAIQPIIKAIKELVAVAGKPKAVFPLVAAKPEARAIIERVAGPKMSDAIFGKEKQVRQANVDALKVEAKAALLAELGEGKFADHDLNDRLRGPPVQGLPPFRPRQGRARRRARRHHHPPDLLRGRRAAPRARLRPLPARRHPGPGHHDARAHQGGAGTRRAHRRRQVQELHPPLQLPAVLRRRDRPHHRTRPPRNRPRRARRAFAAPRRSARGRVPLLDPA